MKFSGVIGRGQKDPGSISG